MSAERERPTEYGEDAAKDIAFLRTEGDFYEPIAERYARLAAEAIRLRAAIAAVEEEFADYKHIREQPGQGIGYDWHLRHCDRPQAHRDDEVWNEQRAALSAKAPEASR